MVMIAVIAAVVVFGTTTKFTTRAAALVGDINKDGIISVLDLSLLLSSWGKTGASDLNADGIVNVFDLSMLLAHWGQLATTTPSPTPVPTPAPTPTPVPVVYCGGLTPCYGPTQLAQHASISGSCWGYNLTWVIDLTAFAPDHPNGPDNILSTTVCGKDIAGALGGTVSSGGGTHNHFSATKSNAANSILSSYKVGYFDANKP
jgi:hypothetical protein